MFLISVIIPLFNSRVTLPSCLNSVVKQTYTKIEIILVDDGSEEEYSDIITSFHDRRIVYYKLKHSNANVARNYGIKQSKGAYIAMLDSDDLWLSDHLEDCLNTLENIRADGLYGSLIVKNEKNGYEQKFNVRPLNEGETMIDYLLSSGYGAQTSSLFLTSESAKKILWDETLQRHQDYDYVIRYSSLYRILPKNRATVIYTLPEGIKKIDFDSCIRVINKYKNDISPYFYNRYHQNMLKLATKLNAEERVIDYYRKESVRYPEYIPYSIYILICKPRSRMEQLKYKLAYFYRILWVIVE